LQDRFRIYALDQRGHGESDRDFDRFSLDDFVRDAVDFIEHTIGRPVTLVGHCMGGLVAQHLAANNPDLVDRLVLIGTASNAHRNPAFAASGTTTSDVFRKVAEALSGDARSVSHRIGCPTLVLWGGRDPFFDRVAQLALSSALRQVKSVDYPDIGHAPNRQIPAEVARDILSFCMQ
jgi:non-heme chloroperoxidase